MTDTDREWMEATTECETDEDREFMAAQRDPQLQPQPGDLDYQPETFDEPKPFDPANWEAEWDRAEQVYWQRELRDDTL